MDNELNHLYRLLSEKNNLIELLKEELSFLRNHVKAQDEVLLKISGVVVPQAFVDDVKHVKKSVDDLTSSVDDRLQSITDMVQGMRRELNEMKKDRGKNAELSLDDLYGTQSSQGILLTRNSPKLTGLLGQNLSTVTSSTATTTCQSSKPAPVNVVITSSDPLPSIRTTMTQPVLSVTIPPQHIKSNVQKPQAVSQASATTSTSQAHNYQILLPANGNKWPGAMVPSVLSQPSPAVSMPSLLSNVPSPAFSAIAKGQSPARNVTLGIQIENTLDWTFSSSPKKADTSLNKGNVSTASIKEYNPRPDFHPIIPLPDEVPVNTGFGNIEILFNPETSKVRIIMRSGKVHKICANHFLTKDTSLSSMATNDRCYTWAAHNYADGVIAVEEFCVRFRTAEEAKKFADAFELAKTKISENNKPAETKREPAAGLYFVKPIVTGEKS